jgi:hypothetical protein
LAYKPIGNWQSAIGGFASKVRNPTNGSWWMLSDLFYSERKPAKRGDSVKPGVKQSETPGNSVKENL